MRDIEKYTEDYNQPNFEDYQIIYRRKKILEIMDQYNPKRILEIGCGMEPLFQYIEFKYDIYTVIEPSKVFCDNAKRLAVGNTRISCYNEYFASSEKLKKQKFDFIICSSLLHEMEEPIAFLKEIATICNEQTVLHVNVPNAYSLHRLLAKEMGLIGDEHDMSERNRLYQQNNVYDMNLLNASLEKAGFFELERGTYFIKPFTHTQMYQMMSQKIIDENVLGGLYELGKVLKDFGSEIYINAKIRL